MIFLNGRLVPAAEARIDPADRGLLLADGLFETLPSQDGRPVLLDRHLERLERGAAILGIPLPLSRDELSRAAADTLAASGLGTGSASLRITVTRGPGPRGLLPPAEPEPTLMVTASAIPPLPDGPARAIIATTRRNEHSPLANVKALGYLDNILARREAEARGADEALLLNTAGRLASASAANLFLVRGGSLLTPPSSEGVLPGVTRAAVIELAEGQGLTVAEVSMEPADLSTADEAFLTNSLIELRALVAVDGKAIGGGRPGPVTERLHQAYREAVR